MLHLSLELSHQESLCLKVIFDLTHCIFSSVELYTYVSEVHYVDRIDLILTYHACA